MSIVSTLKALSDGSRLRLFAAFQHGSFSVGELQEVVELSQSTVSHHLKILHSAGLISQQRQGTWIYYRLSSEDDPVADGVRSALENASAEDETANLIRSDRERVQQVLAKRRDKTRSFFDTVASDWHTIRLQAEGSADYLEELARLIPDEGALLELGCGSGALLEKLLPRGGETIGVDYSPSMVEEAKERLSRFSPTPDLRLGSLEHLPVADESVETAVGCMVFHHLNDPQEALLDAARVLVDNGRLVIVELVEHENEEMRDRFADQWLGFETEEFSRWVEAAGFEKPTVQLLGDSQDVFLLTTNKQKGLET